MNKEAALVVFSGGQDSTTCLFWAKREFKKVYALSFLYGQKHRKEVELAREIARKAEVEFEHCRCLCTRERHQSYRDGCVANGFQRLSRLPGRVYQVAQRNAQPCHGRAVCTAHPADVDR